MFKKENVERTYLTVYDVVNKTLDKLRKTILLHEFPSLVRVKIFIINF